ncbi:MAG: TadE family protein [Nitrolancea sp.]
MIQVTNQSKQRYRGQSLVELALVTPILLLLLMISIDVGAAMSAYNTVGSMARQGAYYGSQNPDDTTGISSAALGESGAIYGVSPTVSSSVVNDSFNKPGTTTPYQTVIVTVTYHYNPIFSFPPMPSSLTIKRQVEMRVMGSS